ncbi:hypothetical protein AVEN_118404-1 [Araneus ventricosus]|uniref:Uncharacterized protein n=1 Tax=Araneus ventricosus TaxID=182803 RepID=A0A4Y2B6S6_ARAVE|nr:hypothetical protein AVEN_118404-1 [Araneus ventricosus]
MRNERAGSQPPPGFHTFLQGILDANIPIRWIVNKNVKVLILLSQADPKGRDQSSPSTLNESKPKKLTIAERLQTFSNPETSPEPEKEAIKKTLSDPESSPTIQLKQWTNWEEAKYCRKLCPSAGRSGEIEETLLRSQRAWFSWRCQEALRSKWFKKRSRSEISLGGGSLFASFPCAL